MNNKGFVTSYIDWFKGFIGGLILGILLTYLVAKGIIPLAFSIC